MALDLESRLRGTKRGHITLEFFTNSAHFPLANMFLELLREGPGLLLKPDLFVMFFAAIAQAWYLGTWRFAGTPRPFLGNLIGPTIYTILETAMEGPVFFGSMNHAAYFLFSAVIGLLQEARLKAGSTTQKVIYICENIVRTSILLVMYWIFEAMGNEKYATIAGFLSDKSHVFIMLALVFVGALLGFATLVAESYQSILRETAQELRRYSEWFLGRDLLSSAVADPAALSIQRRERTLVFLDIRGFTGWSETQPPEKVVDMLNRFFELAEAVWKRHHAIKIKFTGDEIMLVFASAQDAAESALKIGGIGALYLKPFALAAGTGIHTGVLVEGLIGSRDVKGYDVIGDTVNTAKRICDKASGGEVLLSECTKRLLEGKAVFGESRQITAKGKTEPLTVYALHSVTPGPAGPPG